MGLFDWLKRGRSQQPTVAIAWQVVRVGGELTVEDGRGGAWRVPLGGARFVRVVPLTGGQAHMNAAMRGWQVALSQVEGDVLVGKPMQDWRPAMDLAKLLVDKTGLPLDETTERMFSRVGQFSQPKAQD